MSKMPGTESNTNVKQEYNIKTSNTKSNMSYSLLNNNNSIGKIINAYCKPVRDNEDHLTISGAAEYWLLHNDI